MAIDAGPAIPGQKKRINWSNIALGGIMNMFEVSSLPAVTPSPSRVSRLMVLAGTPILPQRPDNPSFRRPTD